MSRGIYIGNRQRFEGVNIPTSLLTIGYITDCLGAIGFRVKIWGGSNAANNLADLQVTPSFDGVSPAKGGTTLEGNGYGGLTNGTEATGLAAEIWNQGGITNGPVLPITVPFMRLQAQMLTAVSNGCVIDVWPIYEARPDIATGALPA